MTRLALLLILAVLTLLAGCSGAATRNREAWSEYAQITVKRDEARAAQQRDAIGALAGAAAACNGDARCVEHTTAVAALALVGIGQGGAGQTPIAPPPREPSGVEKFAAVAGALAPIVGTAVTGAVQWHQSDTSRDVSLAQYGFLAGTVHDVAGAAATMQPSVAVGGDYVSGNGNSVTRGHVGDAIGGSVVGGDQIGRDRTDNSGVIHTGDGDRYTSPGPWTGPICTGDTCQPTGSGNGSGG